MIAEILASCEGSVGVTYNLFFDFGEDATLVPITA